MGCGLPRQGQGHKCSWCRAYQHGIACCDVVCGCVQAVFGLERLVDSTIAKKVPSIAYGTTIAIRFVNNVIGGFEKELCCFGKYSVACSLRVAAQ